MNQIDICFGIITCQAIRRGTFVSVNHLIARIRDYVKHWNGSNISLRRRSERFTSTLQLVVLCSPQAEVPST